MTVSRVKQGRLGGGEIQVIPFPYHGNFPFMQYYGE